MGNGLLFGRTFCNCLERLALTILREQERHEGWGRVIKWFVGLTESKPDLYEVLSHKY